MNTWALVSLIIAGVYVVGLAAVVVCAKFAREGYEDAEGFHFGAEPAADQAHPARVTLNFARDAKLTHVA